MMKRSIVKIFFLLMMLFSASVSFAQEKEVEMADGMRSNGKIYIVVAVCLTILIGLFLYVWNIDRKVSRLEKDGH
ncbi:MAG: CcmD family protein [Ferruginibacter sp.]